MSFVSHQQKHKWPGYVAETLMYYWDFSPLPFSQSFLMCLFSLICIGLFSNVKQHYFYGQCMKGELISVHFWLYLSFSPSQNNYWLSDIQISSSFLSLFPSLNLFHAFLLFLILSLFSFSFPLFPSSSPLAFPLPSFLSFFVFFFPLPWLLSWAIL